MTSWQQQDNNFRIRHSGAGRRHHNRLAHKPVDHSSTYNGHWLTGLAWFPDKIHEISHKSCHFFVSGLTYCYFLQHLKESINKLVSGILWLLSDVDCSSAAYSSARLWCYGHAARCRNREAAQTEKMRLAGEVASTWSGANNISSITHREYRPLHDHTVALSARDADDRRNSSCSRKMKLLKLGSHLHMDSTENQSITINRDFNSRWQTATRQGTYANMN